jgi:phenylalanine-4-hydroxylase
MIIVTGANGFIGSALVRELNEAGFQDIICVDTVGLAQRPEPLAGCRFARFLSKDQIWNFLEDADAIRKIRAVVHMGACSSTTEMDVAFLTENNFDYTRRLWNWCTQNAKTFIYASSGAVYGGGEKGFDDATSPDLFKALNPYGESKAAFDRWAVRENRKPPTWLGLRFFNVYGPGEAHKGDMASVVFKSFQQIQKTGKLQLFRSHRPDVKDGEQMRDFVYIKDITRWILELLKSHSVPSGIYNMGYGQARSWLELARAAFGAMGTEMKIEWIDVPERIRARYQYFTEAKIERLMSLGLSAPKWTIEKGVADYVTTYVTGTSTATTTELTNLVQSSSSTSARAPMTYELPSHLQRYVVKQNYARYTPVDQAVWRYIMRQLTGFLGRYAHPCYLQGLQKTGISVDRIPDIEEMSLKLENFGWRAIPVSGFIPPAAFMELQSLGYLPIASDMRTPEHIMYTPAPDIVHEAAGHAPILVDQEYAAYLRSYAQIARKAIISSEDVAQYEAIRVLSDLKEDPDSSPEAIAQAEVDLLHVSKSITEVSEAALLGRMNWWTAEYGLIGSLENPKIFGAGLLSSFGEARECLSAKVKKIPLSIDCIHYSYDITEPQPQLFVTPTFSHLGLVLEEFAETMAFRRGGVTGLERAKSAGTVNTVELNSGLQISGRLKSWQLNSQQHCYLKFEGPVQLACEGIETPGQGCAHHPSGFGSPVGKLFGMDFSFVHAADAELSARGIVVGQVVTLRYESGVTVKGKVLGFVRAPSGALQIIKFENCRVVLSPGMSKTGAEEVLFDPSWGVYDMAVGETVTSVFGGPADRGQYGQTEDFAAKVIPQKVWSPMMKYKYSLYSEVAAIRAEIGQRDPATINKSTLSERINRVLEQLESDFPHDWLLRLEILRLAEMLPSESWYERVKLELKNLAEQDEFVRGRIEDDLAASEAPLPSKDGADTAL